MSLKPLLPPLYETSRQIQWAMENWILLTNPALSGAGDQLERRGRECVRRRTGLELVGRLDFYKSLETRSHPTAVEYDFSLFLRATGHVLLYGYCLVSCMTGSG